MNKLPSPLMLALDRALQAFAEPAHRETVRDHFGSNVDRFYGVRIPRVREIAAETIRRDGDLSLPKRWKLCEELTASGVFEHKIAAFHLAWLVRKQWTERDLPRFARWLHRVVDDWMDTDDLCIRIIGEFFLRFPGEAGAAIEWSRRKPPGRGGAARWP